MAPGSQKSAMFELGKQTTLITMKTLCRSVFSMFLLLCFHSLSSQESANKITLEDLLVKNIFNPRGIQGLVSMNDGVHYTVRESDAINQYRYDDGAFVQTILNKENLIPKGAETPLRINSYVFSTDERKILIATNTSSIYRHSSQSDYYVFNRDDQMLYQVSTNGKQQLADFSPDGNLVAFVRDNNLYLSDYRNGIETQITTDGLERHIINGTTDWVYEEEFSITKGFFWSPDGRRIAFMRFDESRVKEYWMTNYGSIYPDHHKFKYPKAGEDNSIVTIHVYDLDSGNIIEIETGNDTNIYIPRIQWTADPFKLSIQRLNRHQNHLEILLADVRTGKTHLIYSEENKYYIDITDDLTFLKDGTRFIISNETSGFNHLYLYGMNGKLIRPLTSGNWDVSAFYGIDPDEERIYFQAAKQSPVNREIYSVSLSGEEFRVLSGDDETTQARFSKTYEYFISTSQSVSKPPVYAVHNSRGELVRTIEENSSLTVTISDYNFSPVEFFSFQTQDHVVLNGWMIKPPDFDPNRKYPVMFYVYGGPGSQTVLNIWGRTQTGWFQMLAQMGYIIVSVDNRGTGARGEEFKKMTYLQLGKYETIDQIEAAKYLSSLPYVDKSRIGIFGWSYGGYMALMCLTKGSEYFNAGIAVAPVTSWEYYDNIYTERYMRTPAENPHGYFDNSPLNFADLLKGKLLLIHGSSDDNVHVENTIDMADALIKADKQFELMIYPNRNHGIYGGNTRLHLYRLMTNFLQKNL